MKSRLKGPIVYALLFLAGGVVAFILSTVFYNKEHKHEQDRYPLISSRVFVDNPTDKVINFTGLRNQLTNYITKSIGEENVSFYFEYLPTGSSFAFGENNEFIASSLLKVPQVMSLYKAHEQGGLSLDDEVTLKSEWLDSNFGELYKKGAGYKLTLREAANLALENSDNTAVNAIQSVLPTSMKPEDEAINYLDMDYDLTNDQNVVVKSESIGSIFKCLYFSCYLQVEHSHEILEHLTNTPFDSRIVKGVSNDEVKIAHKIGTRSTTNQSDCGIVYVPLRNYLICIMINQPDPEGSEKAANLSELVYDFINNIKLDK